MLVLDELLRQAHAGLGRTKITTRAGVSRCYEHEVGWEGDGVHGSSHGDCPVFQGLAESFEGVFGKFWEFVKEQYTVVTQAYLARFGYYPPPTIDILLALW